MKMDDHVQFYEAIQKEFGPLNPHPYKVVSDEPALYIVYMVRQTQNLDVEVNPLDILVVTVELAPDQPKLSKSLGLGSLMCYQKQ